MAQLLLVDSVGIELETENIPRSIFPASENFSGTHDASIESELLSWNNVPIVTDVENFDLRRNVFGTEVVSRIINTDREYLSILKGLTYTLLSMGESERSYRAGFHVHVNTPINLKILKSIIRLGRNLEQVFFLLGGMGYDYRGKKNDSIYCRPITKFGPLCVKIPPRSFAQCFNVSELVTATSIEQFKERYGDLSYLTPRVGRYVPVRYHWLNLKPLFEQGSLEFRVFNKSLNPHFLWAIIEMCKAFSFFAIESSFQSLKEEGLLKENSVFDVTGEKDKEKIIRTFEKFVELSSLRSNPQAVEILYDILNQSDINSIVLPKEYVYTHLMNYNGEDRCPRHWDHDNVEYTPQKISASNIKRPEYIDLYQQRNSIPRTSEEQPRRPTYTRLTTTENEREEQLRRYLENVRENRYISSSPSPLSSSTTSTGSYIPPTYRIEFGEAPVENESEESSPDEGIDLADDVLYDDDGNII